jgi:hypothetical protein
LHASTGGEAGKCISGDTILFGDFAIQEMVSIWVAAREIEEIDAAENDEEAA